jgi:hypothetical protein
LLLSHSILFAIVPLVVQASFWLSRKASPKSPNLRHRAQKLIMTIQRACLRTRSTRQDDSQNKIAAFQIMSAGSSAREAVCSQPLSFGLRIDGGLRCADVRPLPDPTDRRCGRGGDPSAQEGLIRAAIALLRVRNLIPRVPTVIRSENASR